MTNGELLLTPKERLVMGKGYEWLVAYKEELDYFLKAQLAKADPLIRKDEREGLFDKVELVVLAELNQNLNNYPWWRALKEMVKVTLVDEP